VGNLDLRSGIGNVPRREGDPWVGAWRCREGGRRACHARGGGRSGGLAVSWLNFSVWKQGSVWVARKRSGCARGNRRIGASRSIRTPISGAKRFTTPKRMSPSRLSGVNREIDATGTPARGVGKHPSFARAVKQLSKRRLEIPDTHGPWGLRRGGLDLSPVLVDVVVVLLGVLNLRHDALVLSRVRAACRAQVRVRRTRVASLHIAVGLRIHTRSEREALK
jgi:hypothetical protein